MFLSGTLSEPLLAGTNPTIDIGHPCYTTGMDEIWKPIPIGKDGWYEASNLGRIRRAKGGRGAVIGRILRQHPYRAKPEYAPRCRTTLRFGDFSLTREVGHLVARAFLGPPEEGQECAHLDENPWNNRPENLRWATRQENFLQSLNSGRIQFLRGEQQSQSKLTSDDVRAIRKSAKPSRQLAKEYGVCKTNILEIKSGKNWAHVKD